MSVKDKNIIDAETVIFNVIATGDNRAKGISATAKIPTSSKDGFFLYFLYRKKAIVIAPPPHAEYSITRGEKDKR